MLIVYHIIGIIALFMLGFFSCSLLTIASQSDTPIVRSKPPEPSIDSLDRLIDAIGWVESKNVISAVGDDGEAVGILQIHKIMVDDVNRIVGYDKFGYQDRLNFTRSRQMCRIYLTHYCSDMSTRDKARCWNGGPTGYKKSCSVSYGTKVMNRMYSNL